jgi:protein O-GlcNAc transferase
MGQIHHPHRALILLQSAALLALAAPRLLAQQPAATLQLNAPYAAPSPLDLARQQLALSNYAAAVQLFRSALTTPNPATLSSSDTLAYATALAATGDTAAAQQQLTDALALTPGNAPLNDALGTLIAQSGHIDTALPYFQRAVAADPTLATAQYHLGTALLALNQPTDAISPLTLAAAAQPNRFDFQLQLGKALSATHQDADALTHLHSAIQLATPATSPDAIYALALALQASGDPKSSIPLFQTATTSTSASASSSDALINYALARVQTGDAIDAITLYKRALSLGPDTPTLREDFGVAYLQQSDLDHALEQFRAGLALEPSNAHLHYDLGLALKLKDNLTAAVPEFQLAEQLDPTLPDPPYTLGVIYMQQGHFPEAIAQLKLAAQLQPQNGDVWALLGSILKDSNDPAGAIDALTRAIALEPDQPSLHIQLASLDMEAGKREEAAAERKIAADLSRAANNRQRAGFALKSGRVLLDQNKVPEAILQLKNAVDADPTQPEPHHLLAEAYARQGDPTQSATEAKLAADLATAQANVTASSIPPAVTETPPVQTSAPSGQPVPQ